MQYKEIDFLNHNESAWDKQALEQNEWSKPISFELIELAKKGIWDIYLTPTPLDKCWLGQIKNKKILCLASAGGQQAPTLAAAGAKVTVYDISSGQLNQDKLVAERNNLQLKTVQGDMRDLSIFKDETFDLIFHPISNHYIENVNLVWKEAHRILKKKGVLLSSFFNPVVFIADRNPKDIDKDIIKPKYTLPYSDIQDLEESAIRRKLEQNEALVFGHTLTDLIGGQLKAGFVITDFLEENQPHPRFVIDKYLPTFLATRAIKQ